MKILLVFVASLVVIQAFKPDDNTKGYVEGNVNANPIIGKVILESVQQIISDLLQNALNLLNELRTALAKLLESAARLLTGIINDVEKLLLAVAEGILEQIQQVAEIHLPCVEEQEQNIQKILAAAREDHHACINTAFDAINAVNNLTSSFETEISDQIGIIKQLLSQCFSINPIELIGCVAVQGNVIGESLSKIAINARQSIKVAATAVGQIVEDARSCIDNTQKDLLNQLEVVRNDVINCIESQKPNSTNIL